MGSRISSSSRVGERRARQSLSLSNERRRRKTGPSASKRNIGFGFSLSLFLVDFYIYIFISDFGEGSRPSREHEQTTTYPEAALAPPHLLPPFTLLRLADKHSKPVGVDPEPSRTQAEQPLRLMGTGVGQGAFGPGEVPAPPNLQRR